LGRFRIAYCPKIPPSCLTAEERGSDPPRIISHDANVMPLIVPAELFGARELEP
jgi:hypothetical protein